MRLSKLILKIRDIKINVLLMTFYLMIVMSSVFIDSIRLGTSIFVWLILSVVCFVLSYLILTAVKKIQIKIHHNPKRSDVRNFLLFFSISLCYLLIWFLAFFPGFFSSDSITQYEQAITGNYSDWHPVWHTLLIYTLPLKVFHHYGSIIAVQIIVISIAIGYMCMVVLRWFNLKIAIISLSYILLNPYSTLIFMMPWKDTAMAVACLICCTKGLDIWFSNGDGLRKWYDILLLGVSLTNVTLFRHNGILFSFLFCVALFIVSDKKNAIKTIGVVAILLLIIKGVLYPYLDVQKPDSRVMEITGLPMTVIGNVIAKAPEKVDDEVKEFAYSVASRESWEEYYVCGDFNSVKWEHIDINVINEAGVAKILKLTVKCFAQAPRESVEATIALTDLVYGISHGVEGGYPSGTSGDSYGFVRHDIKLLKSICVLYTAVIRKTHIEVIFLLGTSILMLITSILSKSKLNKKEDWKRILLCLPILVYDLGTMLLLTGPDYRFFYASIMVTPICLLLFSNKDVKNGN